MNQTLSTVVLSALVSIAVVTGYAWLFKTDEFGTQIAIVDYDAATRGVDVRDPQAVDSATRSRRSRPTESIRRSISWTCGPEAGQVRNRGTKWMSMSGCLARRGASRPAAASSLA